MRTWFAASVLLMWATALLGPVTFLTRAWRALRNPFELDYGEGVVLYQVGLLADFKAAYRGLEHFPYLTFAYPPVYHAVARLIAPVTGDLLLAGRLLSIASMAGISALSGLLVWGVLPRRMPLSIRSTGAALSAMLCLSIPSAVWASYMRVDMLALFFEFAGVYLYVTGQTSRPVRYAAFGCFVLAVFTKPTMVAGLFACASVGALVSYKDAAKQLGLLAGGSVGVLAALSVATHGGFIRSMVLYNVQPLRIGLLLLILKDNLRAIAPIAALSLALPANLAFVLLATRGGRLNRFRVCMRRSAFHRTVAVLGLFLAAAFIVSLTAAKQGASINYTLEWNLAAAPLAALLVAQVLRAWHRQPHLLPSHAAILALPVLYMLGEVGVTSFVHQDYAVARRQRDAALVLERLRAIDGPVYSTDLVLLYRAGKSPVGDANALSTLAETGKWDDTPLARRFESGYFALVVSDSALSDRSWYSPNVEHAIEHMYRERETVGAYTLYEPRTPGSLP